VRLVLIGGIARSGKSMAAQVCKELLVGFGRTAHVIALDAWLKPAAQRSEGSGVLSRYEVLQAAATLSEAARSKSRVTLETPVYDPANRRMHRHPKRHSVGAGDVLIVEGVPALSIPELRAIADVTAYVETAEDERMRRLSADYAWRGTPGVAVARLAASRALDESPVVAASRSQADFIFSS
jgi:uridine kinase